MFKYNLPLTDSERKEQSKIAARKAFDDERKKRIFNAKQRIIGIDYEILDRQIEEKRKRDQDEKRKQELYDQELISRDKLAVELEQKEQQLKRRIQREINDYRRTCQSAEDRREADRSTDEQPRSFAEQFIGDDTTAAERKSLQRQQLRAFLDQQIYEKVLANREKREMEVAFAEYLNANDRKAVERSCEEQYCRKREHEAIVKFNQEMVMEKQTKKDKEKEKEFGKNLAEMHYVLTTDLFAEIPDAAINAEGSKKKGLTSAEMEEIRKYQLEQIEAARRRRDDEKKYSEQIDNFFSASQQRVYEEDQKTLKKIKEINKEIAEENLRLACEHKRTQEYLRKTVYNTTTAPEFYDQFNKSTR